MKFLKVTNAGSNQVTSISINPKYVVSVQKPVRDTFGCIITVAGEKFPVKETYSEVMSFLEEAKE